MTTTANRKTAALWSAAGLLALLALTIGWRLLPEDDQTGADRISKRAISAPPAPDAAWTAAGFAPASVELDPDAGSAARVTTTPAPEWPALPPVETPLADVFDALAERGRRGDTKAACRLATGLQRCTRAKLGQTYAQDLERDLARSSAAPDSAIDTIARIQDFTEIMGDTCDGLSEAQLRTAFDWQRQAAALDPDQRLGFIQRPALDRRDFLSDYERWGEYRRLALPWLEAAARESDPAAIIMLARVYGDHRRNAFLAPPFRIRDDERFAFYAGLMDRHGLGLDVVRNAASQARARLSPEANVRVDNQLAEALQRQPAPALDADAVEQAHRSSLQPPRANSCD